MLSETEREVLVRLLVGGDDTPSNISDAIGKHRVTVQDALKSLQSEDMVRNKNGGVYALTLVGAAAARDILADSDVDLDVSEN